MTLAEVQECDVRVVDQRIIVTMEGTSFLAIYYWAEEGAKLLQSEAMGSDRNARIDRRDFERLAWEAANAKAGELGWIA